MPASTPGLSPLVGEHDRADGIARVIIARLESGTIDDGARQQLRQMAIGLWNGELRGHFDDEDSVYGPASRETGDAGAEMAERVSHEHQQIAQSLTFVRVAQGANLEPRLRDFASQLLRHHDFERNAWFPHLARTLSGGRHRELAEQLLRRRKKDGRGSPLEERAARSEVT